MRDASTSHLTIPDVVDHRPPEDSFNTSEKKHLKRSLIIGLASLPAVLMLGYFGAIRGAEKKFFVEAAQKSKSYFRPIIPELDGKILNVSIKTSDNLSLKCWDINPHNHNKYIIVCHGNSQNLNECQELYSTIHKKGYGVFALEYRGYAENPGKVTEDGLYKDAEAALKYLRDKGVEDKKIGLVGYSLGGAVAVDLRKKNKNLGGIILMSTFHNALDLSKNAVNYLELNIPKKAKKAIDIYPNWLIPLQNKYRSDKKIGDINGEIVFIHSRDDNAIPISESKKLLDKAQSATKKRLITLPSGSHWFDQDKYSAISEALDELSL